MLREFELSEFDEIYQIMQESFPFDERRTFEGQKKLLSHQNYKLLVKIAKDNQICGFVALWDFENFLFLEHLAIAHTNRNQGLGGKILDELKEYTNKKIILEVEYPTDDKASRRIEFYKRKGFEVFDFGYIMPAYTQEHSSVPLLLMSNSHLTQEDFDDFYDKIINIVNV